MSRDGAAVPDCGECVAVTLVNCSITLVEFVQVLLTVAKGVKVPDNVEQ